jgi:hypothetical protein
MTLYSSERGLQKPVELATQLNAFTPDVRLKRVRARGQAA